MDTHPEGTADDAVDPWAWVNETDEAESLDLGAHRVTAVLVSHDGAEWLPAALDGLAHLTPGPDRVVLVDAGSDDETASVLAEAADAQDHWQVASAPAGSYAGAVRVGLDAVTDPGSGDSDGAEDVDGAEDADRPEDGDRTDWVWLLHDDAVPRPDALGPLVATAVERGAALATPRLVQPATRQDPARLSELGVSVSRSGRREVHVDAGEVDQGQHDTVNEVLGGSTCGLLVRRDVFDELGGLNDALPAHRDGVDLGWRAWLAGHSVVAVPAACVEHRQVGLGSLRSGTEDDAATDRAYGMALVTAHARGIGRVLTPVRLVLASVLRILGFLIGKAPDRARDELAGIVGFVTGHGRVRRIRARVGEIEADDRARARTTALRPGPFSGVRRAVDALGSHWADRDQDGLGSGLDELTGDDFASQEDQRFTWRGAYLVTLAVVVVAALVASRRLFTQGALGGPALLPAASDLPSAFDQWLVPVADWFQGPPWLGVQAALSTLLIGRPEWATTVLVAGAVPLTFLSVWPLAARLLDDRRVRLWAGVSYALLPVLLGGSTQGRLGLTVTAMLLPLVARALVGLVAGAVEGHGWRAAWGGGLALTLLVAYQPMTAPLAVLALVVAGVAVGLEHGRAAAGAVAARAALVVGVVAVALAPWWPTLVTHPSWWLLGPDSSLDGVAEAPSVLEFMIGRPGGEGLPPLWLSVICFAMIWLVALAGAILRPTATGLRGSWAVGLGGLALAIVLTRLVVPSGAGEVWVRPSAAVPLLIGLGGLVLAGAVGVDAVSDDLSRRDFSWVQPVTALAAAVMVLVTLLGAGWWVVAGGSGPSARDSDHLVPAFVTDELARQPGTRGLAVEVGPDGVARHVVLTGTGIHLGDADRGAGTGADLDAAERSADVTGRLVAATGDETVAEDLRALGIRYVAVRGSEDLIGRINSTAGLRVVSVHPGERVWEVSEAEPVATAGADGPTAQQIGIGIAQGAWLVIVGFCAAPRLRASRSKDPVLRARFAAGQEVAP